MVAEDFALGASFEVVVVGIQNGKDTKKMIRALRRGFIPNKVVLFRPDDQDTPPIVGIAEFTRYQRSKKGRATAYVCLDYNCKSPTTDVAKMLKLLKMK